MAVLINTSSFKQQYRDFMKASEWLGGAVDVFSATPSRLIYESQMDQLGQLLDALSGESGLFARFRSSLRWGFLFNKTPNAFCWKADDTYYIGITSGLMHLLLDAVLLSLSDNELFSFIADEQKNEHPSRLVPELLSRYYIGEGDDRLLYLHSTRPDNPLRQRIGDFMFSHAVRFIFMHEIGHCLMGHLEHEGLPRNIIREIGDEVPGAQESPNLVLYKEHQADNLGILGTLEYPLSQDIDMSRGYPPDHIAVWSAGVDLVFWLCSKGPIIRPHDNRSSHPHPQSRLAYKTLRLAELNDRVAIEPQADGAVFSSLFNIATATSWQMGRDWVKAGLAPVGWSIFDSPETLVRHMSDAAEFLGTHGELAIAHFRHVKDEMILELFGRYYRSESGSEGPHSFLGDDE